MKTLFHVTPLSNVAPILREGLLPRLGDRSARLEGEEAGVFLFPDYEACTDALSNWLGDEFEELDEELVTLKVELPDDFPLDQQVEWELISRQAIDARYIHFFKNEG